LNGILRKYNILGWGRNCNQLCYTLHCIQELFSWKDPFFRDDYRREVESLVEIIKKCNGFGDFASLLNHNPTRAKNIMQHIYTLNQSIFDDFKESFHFQNIQQHHAERNQSYGEYYKKIRDEIDNISAVKPYFGYCDVCSNYLDRKQRSQYPKLNELDESFWDYSKW